MSKLINFKVVARTLRPLVLVAWSGSAISSIIREACKGFPGSQLIFVSPLFTRSNYDGYEKCVLSGLNENKPVVIDGNVPVTFQYTIKDASEESAGSEMINELIKTLYSHGFKPESLEVREVRLEDIYSDKLQGSERSRYVVTVEFGPTMFVFRSWRVLYPSPIRLIFSSMRTLAELSLMDRRHAMKRAKALIKHLEILDEDIKRIEINIGRGRKVKAFLGKVEYGVYGLKALQDIVALMKLGSYVGVGKSRGIGFGFIKLTKVKELKNIVKPQ